ncbi:DUF1178 domain-containing protein [Pseudooceanicola lipolyticus]|uniref:DUF1178 domain-containing protein n=1 Tax=Pseudooceanicola lipolyticus TaxID=2029104 RepID=A0A2M8J124_9RHOB|nr:DUF1178 family protein [Pseudooceanicola lipolyticus]PJE36448.1 DUF1178 domain-containing protein [Pseudooceanicola lipolyticus]
MIQYALKCAEGHTFDSWFQSAEAFDRLARTGMVSCAVCGGTKVEKAVMTPRVSTGEKPKGPLSKPASPAEQAMAELRRRVEENSDYVGADFVREARAMHDGDIPERAIYGEARIDEARKLAEDGIPVAPLPFMPNRKSN